MSFKIQYCSDLHLEFRENVEFIKNNPLVPEGEILVIAGDLVCFSKQDMANDFISWCSDNFKLTFWLPGNHEYYHSNILDKPFGLDEKIKNNFWLVNNKTFNYKNVDLIFSTLWTKIHPMHEGIIASRMRDFSVIKKRDKTFSPSDCTDFHSRSIKTIENSVKFSEANDRRIVITHHVPTFMNYPPQYKGDIINEAFAVELFDFIEDSDIYAWVYAHSHVNTPEFKIGNTRMLTNQLGYVKYGESDSFKRDAVISL